MGKIAPDKPTAWFLANRIRETMKETHQFFDEPLGGPWRVVEGEETYMGRKAKSRAYKPPGRKQAVVALVERGGSVRSLHVPNANVTNLRPIIARHIHSDGRYMTDSGTVSASLGLPFRIRGRHHTVNNSQDEFVRGDVYTRTVEGYFSILKRGIYGISQHASEVHLQRYPSEFNFRYLNRIALGIDDVERMELAVVGAWGRRLVIAHLGA